MVRISRQRRLLLVVLLTAALLLVALTATRVTATYAQTVASARTTEMVAAATKGNCTGKTCTFKLGVNPGLLSGPFACPAIQKATATITISNRFARNAQNDVMILTASGLPKNTGFDMFLVQHSILLINTLSVAYAHAAGGGSNFSLQPVYYNPADPVSASYFVFNGHPATQMHNSVRVSNIGAAAGTVSLYPVDAFTSDLSGTSFRPHSAPLHDVGAWTVLSRSILTLAPGQSAVVPFQVSIPGHVCPGQHVGGIVAENMTVQGTAPGSLQIAVQQLTIVAVMVNLPGPQTEALTVTGIGNDQASQFQRLLIGLRNTGNLLLQPSGSLKVFDLNGNLLLDIPLKLDTILPQDAINYPVYILHRALPFGKYRASLSLIYGHDHGLIYSTFFAISPPPATGGGLTGLITTRSVQFLSQLALWQYVGGGLILLLLVSIVSCLLFSRYRKIKCVKQQAREKVHVKH